MSTRRKILIAVGTVAGVIALAAAAVLLIANYRDNHYYDYTETGGPIEETYTAMGSLEVDSVDLNTDTGREADAQRLWYPTTMTTTDQTYPLVVIANGTGSVASTYDAFAEHLASWGFIVIGNGDEDARTGESTVASVDYALALNQQPDGDFYGKIDADDIGIGGHSQGGVATVNAANTLAARGDGVQALYLASPTSAFWGQKSQFGASWSYDATQVTAPTLVIAGTGPFDAGEATDITATEGQGIAPLWSLRQTFDDIPADVSKVMALRKDSDHGDSLTKADGYMTAWYMHWLRGDDQAGGAFFGDSPELTTNPNWQDVATSDPSA